MDKYGCGNCGHTWYDNEEPTKCPKCKDWDIYPILVCEDCGLEDAKEDFPFHKLFDGMCNECFCKSIPNAKIAEYIKYFVETESKSKSTAHLDYPELYCENIVVQWVFVMNFDYSLDVHRIAIHYLYLQILSALNSDSVAYNTDLICENARDWAFNDLETFYDWWCEYGRK